MEDNSMTYRMADNQRANIMPIHIVWVKQHINEYEFHDDYAKQLRKKIIAYDENTNDRNAARALYYDFVANFSNNIYYQGFEVKDSSITTKMAECFMANNKYGVPTPLGLLKENRDHGEYEHAVAITRFEMLFAKQDSIAIEEYKNNPVDVLIKKPKSSEKASWIRFSIVFLLCLGMGVEIWVLYPLIVANLSVMCRFLWVEGISLSVVFVELIVELTRSAKRSKYVTAVMSLVNTINSARTKYPLLAEQKMGLTNPVESTSGYFVSEEADSYNQTVVFDRSILVCERTDDYRQKYEKAISEGNAVVPKSSVPYSKMVCRMDKKLETISSVWRKKQQIARGFGVFGYICLAVALTVLLLCRFVPQTRDVFFENQTEIRNRKNNNESELVSEIPAESNEEEREAPKAILSTSVIVARVDKVESSSLLSADYSSFNIIDGDSNTCWQEGVKGDGIGEYITFYFENQILLDHMVVCNGRADRESKYEQNNRLKDIELIFFIDGQETARELMTLKDSYSTEGTDYRFENEISCDSVEIVIKSVYEGSKYEDTCLSEVTFWEKKIQEVGED